MDTTTIELPLAWKEYVTKKGLCEPMDDVNMALLNCVMRNEGFKLEDFAFTSGESYETRTHNLVSFIGYYKLVCFEATFNLKKIPFKKQCDRE
jgi:hypothetical protein